MTTTRPPCSSAAASSGDPVGRPTRSRAPARLSRYPVSTAIPPSPSASSRAATADVAATDASTNEARRARSSTGYPVRNISGKTTIRAPAAAAFLVQVTSSSVFPARSPTVAFTWASAIRISGMSSA